MPVGMYLSDRCDVDRYSEVVDEYRNRQRVPTALATDVPCRLVVKRKQTLSSLTGELVVMTEYRLLVLHDADIVAGDRVKNVRRDDGAVLDVTFEVAADLIRRGRMARHKTIALKQVV